MTNPTFAESKYHVLYVLNHLVVVFHYNLLVGSSQLASGLSGLYMLVTPLYKPFRPFGRGTTLVRGLTNHGC